MIKNIVDELLFVTDMDAAFTARAKCKQEVFSGNPVLASTIVHISSVSRFQSLWWRSGVFAKCKKGGGVGEKS